MQMATPTLALRKWRGAMLRTTKPGPLPPQAVIFEHADDWLLDEQPYAIIPGFPEIAEEDHLLRHASRQVRRI